MLGAVEVISRLLPLYYALPGTLQHGRYPARLREEFQGRISSDLRAGCTANIAVLELTQGVSFHRRIARCFRPPCC